MSEILSGLYSCKVQGKDHMNAIYKTHITRVEQIKILFPRQLLEQCYDETDIWPGLPICDNISC